MLSVVRRLRDLGHDVSWDVYGTGMLQSRMTSKIAELNLGRHVRLMGNVDYRRIPEVLADAFAFIGSGLSMMEAYPPCPPSNTRICRRPSASRTRSRASASSSRACRCLVRTLEID
jgi:hypothetical protein